MTGTRRIAFSFLVMLLSSGCTIKLSVGSLSLTPSMRSARTGAIDAGSPAAEKPGAISRNIPESSPDDTLNSQDGGNLDQLPEFSAEEAATFDSEHSAISIKRNTGDAFGSAESTSENDHQNIPEFDTENVSTDKTKTKTLLSLHQSKSAEQLSLGNGISLKIGPSGKKSTHVYAEIPLDSNQMNEDDNTALVNIELNSEKGSSADKVISQDEEGLQSEEVDEPQNNIGEPNEQDVPEANKTPTNKQTKDGIDPAQSIHVPSSNAENEAGTPQENLVNGVHIRSSSGIIVNVKTRRKETWVIVSRVSSASGEGGHADNLRLQLIRFPNETKLKFIVVSENDTVAKDGSVSRLLFIDVSGTGSPVGTSLEWSHSAQEKKFQGNTHSDQLVLLEATEVDEKGTQFQTASKGPMFVESEKRGEHFELRIVQDEDWDPLENEHLPDKFATAKNDRLRGNTPNFGEDISLTVNEIKATKDDQTLKHYRANLRLSPRLSESLSNALSNAADAKSSGWSDWGRWESCSATCGENGQTHRRRLCAATPGHTSLHYTCQGSEVETRHCVALPACGGTDGNAGMLAIGWSEWSTWSACSVTCGVGSEQQTRSCHQESEIEGSRPTQCLGHANRSRHCVRDSCLLTSREAAKHAHEGHMARLFCSYNRDLPAVELYWVTPHGKQITADNEDARYRVRGDYLYVGHAEGYDRGTYHCVIIRESGQIETGDATLVVDTCAPENPCQNGGVCVEMDETFETQYIHFRCECPDDFKGDLCERVSNPVPLIVMAVLLSCSLVGLVVLCGFLFCSKRKRQSYQKTGGTDDDDEGVHNMCTPDGGDLKPLQLPTSRSHMSAGARRSSIGHRGATLSQSGRLGLGSQSALPHDPRGRHLGSHSAADNVWDMDGGENIYDLVNAAADIYDVADNFAELSAGDEMQPLEESPAKETTLKHESHSASFQRIRKPMSNRRFSTLNRDGSPIPSTREQAPSSYSSPPPKTVPSPDKSESARTAQTYLDENQLIGPKRVSFSDVTAMQTQNGAVQDLAAQSEDVYLDPSHLRPASERKEGRDQDVMVEDSSEDGSGQMSAPPNARRRASESKNMHVPVAADLYMPMRGVANLHGTQRQQSVASTAQLPHRREYEYEDVAGDNRENVYERFDPGVVVGANQQRVSLMEIAGMSPSVVDGQYKRSPRPIAVQDEHTSRTPTYLAGYQEVQRSPERDSGRITPLNVPGERMSTGLSPRAAPMAGRETRMANYLALGAAAPADTTGHSPPLEESPPRYSAFPDKRSAGAHPGSSSVSPKAMRGLRGELRNKGLTPETPDSKADAPTAFGPIPFTPQPRFFSHVSNASNLNNANNTGESTEMTQGGEASVVHGSEATAAWIAIVNTYNACSIEASGQKPEVRGDQPTQVNTKPEDQVNIPTLAFGRPGVPQQDSTDQPGQVRGRNTCESTDKGQPSADCVDTAASDPMDMSVGDISGWLGITSPEIRNEY